MIKYKQQKAKKSEINFSYFCKQREIKCVALDNLDNKSQRQKFLIKPNSKCPDFWCEVKGKSIFVEIKTLTNFTNAAREKFMKENIEALRKAGNSIHYSGSFEPIPELKGPLETFLKDTSNKFKNIKEEYKYPRIMLLGGVFGIESMAHVVFLGAYAVYGKKDGELVYNGWQKIERGLFDKTGSNVSALVFWNKDAKCFNSIANPKAKIEFSKDDFDLFFGIKK